MADWENYESGPFCRHWGDPSDCDLRCASCNHPCGRHDASDGNTECFDCDNCNEWKEPDDGEQRA